MPNIRHISTPNTPLLWSRSFDLFIIEIRVRGTVGPFPQTAYFLANLRLHPSPFLRRLYKLRLNKVRPFPQKR